MTDNSEKGTFQWTYGAVPLARDEIHDKVFELILREPRGRVLDVPTGAGAMALRLKKEGFEVFCCDINPVYFSVPDLKLDIGDLNSKLPYPDNYFDYIICLEGIEHTENPFNAIREFSRILRVGGKLFLSLPNYLNIERRLRFLFDGTFSKIPTHEVLKKIWKNDISMVHLSPVGYPIIKFIMEYYGLNVVNLERDKSKKKMKWLLPLVWLIRVYTHMSSKKRREFYRLSESNEDKIIMGGNTLIVVGEKLCRGKVD